MMHTYQHAQTSARIWGGVPEDYLDLHEWFDETKAHMGDFRHRAMRHHSLGIFWLQEKFGVTRTNSAGKLYFVRYIGEQHVKEDCGGRIPSVQDWLEAIDTNGRKWMAKGYKIGVSDDEKKTGDVP